MNFVPRLPGDTETQTEALLQIEALRSTLDYIRSVYTEGDLTRATSAALAAMAALREELKNSIANARGNQLISAVEKLEGGRIAAEGGTEFPLNHARHTDREEFPEGYDRDCRVLARAWDASWSAEQLRERLSASEAATECGEMAARALVTHYEDVKEFLQSRL
ncbi:hypothetical protein [Marinobacter sp.]|uniref:hypothetical protein n=1 Tax=Marinobacter sp. TaxID=50741 RepID=UPI003A8FF6EF